MAEVLELARELPGSAGQVFSMWTVPDLMRRWLFASESSVLIRVEAAPVVGGRYSILELNNGLEVDHFGHYIVVEPPHRLRFTLRVPQHFPETTEISLAIEQSAAGRSLLRFRQTGIDPEKTRPYWRDMLDQLAAFL